MWTTRNDPVHDSVFLPDYINETFSCIDWFTQLLMNMSNLLIRAIKIISKQSRCWPWQRTSKFWLKQLDTHNTKTLSDSKAYTNSQPVANFSEDYVSNWQTQKLYKSSPSLYRACGRRIKCTRKFSSQEQKGAWNIGKFLLPTPDERCLIS